MEQVLWRVRIVNTPEVLIGSAEAIIDQLQTPQPFRVRPRPDYMQEVARRVRLQTGHRLVYRTPPEFLRELQRAGLIAILEEGQV